MRESIREGEPNVFNNTAMHSVRRFFSWTQCLTCILDTALCACRYVPHNQSTDRCGRTARALYLASSPCTQHTLAPLLPPLALLRAFLLLWRRLLAKDRVNQRDGHVGCPSGASVRISIHSSSPLRRKRCRAVLFTTGNFE